MYDDVPELLAKINRQIGKLSEKVRAEMCCPA